VFVHGSDRIKACVYHGPLWWIWILGAYFFDTGREMLWIWVQGYLNVMVSMYEIGSKHMFIALLFYKEKSTAPLASRRPVVGF